MTVSKITRYPKLKGALAFVCLGTGLLVFLSLVSYYPLDPSWNTAASDGKAVNLIGLLGAFLADLLLQGLGIAAYSIPVLIVLLGWRWARGGSVDTAWFKTICGIALVAATATGMGLFVSWKPIAGNIPAGGLIGSV